MGYYADVDGHIDFNRSLKPDEIQVLEDLLGSGWYECAKSGSCSTEFMSCDFWSGDKYYCNTWDMLNDIAKKLPVKGGIVHCHGEDGDHWKYQFKPGIPHGGFSEIYGRVLYDDELPVTEDNRAEFVGQIIDVFEDFLERKGIDIWNEDKLESDGPAIIYGMDYGELQTGIENILYHWNVTA